MRRGLAGLACVGLLGLLAASDPGGTATAASGGASGDGRRPPAGTPSPSSPPVPPSPPPVLAAPVEGAPQTAAGVARALARPLSDPRLGPRVAATVVDAATGQVLLDRGAGTYATPASTAKLATAVALLATTPADRQLSTQVVLVGGGDPTLSAAPAGRRPAYEGAPRIASLAAAVRRPGVSRPSRVVV